jgi:hypothetical protein
VNPENGTGIYSDWVLPTNGDYGLLGKTYMSIPGFSGTYWTSTGGGGGAQTKAYEYVTGTGSAFVPKTGTAKVRAIRYF